MTPTSDRSPLSRRGSRSLGLPLCLPLGLPLGLPLCLALALASACTGGDGPKAGEDGCTEGESIFYGDEDGDGYGDIADTKQACVPPEGFVDNDEDCDDTQATVHPGAAEIDCEDPTDYNCDGSVGFADADQDSYAACKDCDDAEATVHPGQDEVCDGIDNDCNAVVDYPSVDAPTWFIDYDGDGYGDDRYTLEQCGQPFGYVATDDDCDDTTALAHPGGEETCDGADNDCDGLIDPETSTGAVTVYDDLDGDTYGDPASELTTCYPDDDQVDDDSDCDDADALINPAAVEVCNDGEDNDCEGTAMGCTLDLMAAELSLQGEAGGDYAGVALSTGDWNGDGQADLLVGAYGHDAATAGTEGGAYVLWGPLGAGTESLSSASLSFAGESAGDRAGAAVSSVGDIDSDGVDDLVIAAERSAVTTSGQGRVYLFLGATLQATTPGDALSLDLDADRSWKGADGFDWLGAGLVSPGDLDGDGVVDLALAATNDEVGGSQTGSIYVLLGGSAAFSGTDGVSAASVASATFTGEATGDYAGAVMSGLGDLDGDGAAELAVGVGLASFNGTHSGAAYLLSAPFSGTQSLSEATGRLLGAATGDRAGAGLCPAGDVDGDGYDDAWVGATKEDTGAVDAGTAYLLPGTADLSDYYDVTIDTVALTRVFGEGTGDGLGSNLAGGADWDGDGSPDLLVGVPSTGVNDEGAASLFLGPFAVGGTLQAGVDHRATMVGDTSNDHVGAAVLFGGDLLGSGGEDIVVGAWEDDGAGTDAGGLWVVQALGL
jgi:hypothetical protein